VSEISYKDKMRQAEYMKEWRERNKDKYRAYRRDYYRRNSKKILEEEKMRKLKQKQELEDARNKLHEYEKILNEIKGEINEYQCSKI
jgi:protein-disulfide isomerase